LLARNPGAGGRESVRARPFDKPFDRLTVPSKVEGLTAPSEVEGLTVPSKVEGLTVPSEVEGHAEFLQG
jgi:hypothetical protein